MGSQINCDLSLYAQNKDAVRQRAGVSGGDASANYTAALCKEGVSGGLSVYIWYSDNDEGDNDDTVLQPAAYDGSQPGRWIGESLR